MHLPLFWIACGSVFWPLTLAFTENPAGMPLRPILRRAAPGLLLCALIGFWTTVLAWLVLERLLTGGLSVLSSAESLWMLILLAAIQTSLSKDALIGLNTKFPPATVRAWMQAIDESSRLYLNRMAAREERKLDIVFPKETHDAAVDRAFKECAIAIARRESLRSQAYRVIPNKSAKIVESKVHEVKLKFLLRFHGYHKAVALIQANVGRQAATPIAVSEEIQRFILDTRVHGRKEWGQYQWFRLAAAYRSWVTFAIVAFGLPFVVAMAQSSLVLSSPPSSNTSSIHFFSYFCAVAASLGALMLFLNAISMSKSAPSFRARLVSVGLFTAALLLWYEVYVFVKIDVMGKAF
jgi:hypothetical protein